MQFLLTLALLFVAGSHAGAHEGKATAQGVTEMFATGEAMRLVPKGAAITDTTITRAITCSTATSSIAIANAATFIALTAKDIHHCRCRR